MNKMITEKIAAIKGICCEIRNKKTAKKIVASLEELEALIRVRELPGETEYSTVQ